MFHEISHEHCVGIISSLNRKFPEGKRCQMCGAGMSIISRRKYCSTCYKINARIRREYKDLIRDQKEYDGNKRKINAQVESERYFYRKSVKKWMLLLSDYIKTHRRCIRCGYDLHNAHGRRKYCDQCAHDIQNETMRDYGKRKSAERNEYKRQYMKDHPDKRREKDRKKTLKEKNVPGFHTEQEWANLVELCGYTCVFCLNKFDINDLTRDHIIPISIEGTSDNIYNIQPACRRCNSSKGNREARDRRPIEAQVFFAD